MAVATRAWVFERSIETWTSQATDWQVRGTCLPRGQLPRDKTPIHPSIYPSTRDDDAADDQIRS